MVLNLYLHSNNCIFIYPSQRQDLNDIFGHNEKKVIKRFISLSDGFSVFFGGWGEKNHQKVVTKISMFKSKHVCSRFFFNFEKLSDCDKDPHIFRAL